MRALGWRSATSTPSSPRSGREAIGAVGLGLDVRDDESYEAFLGEVGSRLGPLSVLVNNAGVAIAGSFLATSPGEHELQIDVNLGGVERGLRLALPALLERGSGHVVNIASAAGRIPSPGAAVYAATKHGVVALTDAVRSEVRGSGVHLTSILPTAVHTEMAAGPAVALAAPGEPRGRGGGRAAGRVPAQAAGERNGAAVAAGRGHRRCGLAPWLRGPRPGGARPWSSTSTGPPVPPTTSGIARQIDPD